MIPAILLSKLLTAARRFSPTVVEATPGRLVARGRGVRIQLESPKVVDTFCCVDPASLSTFLVGLRGTVDVVSRGEQVILVARGRELPVLPLPAPTWDPLAASTFSIRLSLAHLRHAVDPFARRDANCLLHYTHDALYFETADASSPLSGYRRSAGSGLFARAVSGQLLRRVAMVLRTDELEMRVRGAWNGAGPVVLSESEHVGDFRLTIAFAAESYRRVRHLVLQMSSQPQLAESIYTGLTEQECEEVAASEKRERAAEWLQMREWDLYRLHAMADDDDRRTERSELVEHLQGQAEQHRETFTDGCGVRGCDVCAATNDQRRR